MEAKKSKGYDLDLLMLRSSPLAHPDSQPCQELRDFVLNETRVLIIGAGGLGCELLKNLAVMGIKTIDIIDLDKIDITNLNRQFLFRKTDVGDYKSKVAADFVRRRCPGIQINHHVGKIQDFSREFYSKFQIFLAGLDNIEARRWLNSLLFSFLEYDRDGAILPESVKILIDGGTESFAGQSRIVVPGQTPCFECTLDTMSESKVYNFCTITHTPRIAEHCIAYAFLIEWDKAFPKRNYDTDSPEDISWIYETALKRAEQFGIEGVTYNKTLGVVKNIIPNIASTNSIIAAACANEFIKVMSYLGPSVDNYMMYMGKNSVNISAVKFEPKHDCIICQTKPIPVECKTSKTVEEWLKELSEQFKIDGLTVVTEDGKYLHAASPPQLYEEHKHKLEKSIKSLLDDGLLKPVCKLIIFCKTLKKEILLLATFI